MRTMYPILEGKTALVTGGASGMGKETAKLFAEAKAQVAVADINEKAGKEVVNSIIENGGDAIFVKMDISDSKSVENAIKEIVKHYGKLNVAVNNAALAPDDKAIVDFDEDYWDKLIDIDMKGTALSMKYEIQEMLKQGQGGSIINISSAITNKVVPNNVAYVSAKWGVRGMTEVAALEYGLKNIRVNSICPGTIDTPMLNTFLVNQGLDPDEFAKNTVALGRFAKPDEVAQASLWLASDYSSFVTGANFNIDGGYSAK